MFSRMDMSERQDLVKKRFNIDLTDKELERLNEMSTLGQDKYDHGYADGYEQGLEKGIEQGLEKGLEKSRENEVKTAVTAILFYAKEMKISIDDALIRFPIREEIRDAVEKEVRRLS